MDAGVVLGGIGTLIALGSFVFTMYAWRTERRDRKEQVSEQLGLERKRFEVEMADRDRRRHADITSSQDAIEDAGDEQQRIYRFTLTNMGPSYSKHVTAYLVDSDGRVRSSRPPGFPIPVGDSIAVALYVPRIAWDPPAPLRLVVAWFGEDGKSHDEFSNLTVQHDIHPQFQR